MQTVVSCAKVTSIHCSPYEVLWFYVMLLPPLRLSDNFQNSHGHQRSLSGNRRSSAFKEMTTAVIFLARIVSTNCVETDQTALMKIKMTPRGQETVLGRGGCNNDCLLVLQWIRLWLSNASPSRRHRNSSCVGPFKIFRIITLVTQKGKGKVCPSQRLWWEESMTSSIFLPQGTGGQRLTGINSCPLISQPVRCLVVSQPFVPLL